MSKELKKLSDFGISTDIKEKVIRLAGGVNKNLASHKDIGMEVGKEIAAAHELLAGDGGDGAFSAWVDGYLKISRQTAYNYMWAWEKFKDCKTVLQFDAGAMYALASPKAPPEAAKEAAKLADKGEKINASKAKELLDKFRTVKPKKKTRPAPPKVDPVDSNPAAVEPPAPPPTGPCIRTGKEHRWGLDEDRPGCQCCLECGEPDSPVKGDPEIPVAKLFAKIDEHLGKVVRLLDEVNHVAPNETLRREIMTSLDVANRDILKWKKGAKK